MSGTVSQLSPDQSLSLQARYEQLCQSYRAIDDFRSKLLGFLTLVSGAGLLALLGPLADSEGRLLLPVGLLGLFVTFGLLCFELNGIRKCHSLINAGRRLESRWPGPEGIADGQFCSRPTHLVDVPFASGVIYSSVGAAWLYTAFSATTSWAWLVSVIAAVLGLVSVLWYAKRRIRTKEPLYNCSEVRVGTPRGPELVPPNLEPHSSTR